MTQGAKGGKSAGVLTRVEPRTSPVPKPKEKDLEWQQGGRPVRGKDVAQKGFNLKMAQRLKKQGKDYSKYWDGDPDE
jgi:hypothetical protein